MNSTPTIERPEAAASPDTYLNVAAYKFVRLENREILRQRLRSECEELGLKGTILLSPEGINLFLAGLPAAVERFLAQLRGRPEFSDLEVKLSHSAKIPFRRMLVRLKKEIIPCGLDEIQPEARTSPKLPARELKCWLDEGRPFKLLDVRNHYEIELGTFSQAEQLDLGHFREFRDAVDNLPQESKELPVVMFCTGGIRCEKAGPLMEQAGFREVYQLDGGILKYFEECGGAHYDGACFVFDGRVALDPQLKPTGNLLCFACQAVLTADDVASGKFLFGQYCPRCYQEPEQQRKIQFLQRQQQIRNLAESQPGSKPYDNFRKIYVPGRFAGARLIDFLSEFMPRISREQWLQYLDAGQLTSQAICKAHDIVREGQCLVHHMPNTVEPEVNPQIELLHEDPSLVVVHKPAPLPCHPSGRFNRNSLLSILNSAYPNEKLRIAHRLDANTTGVVLFCRKYQPARHVQPQFAENLVKKTYLARVQGHPTWDELICNAPIGPGKTGNFERSLSEDGQSAETQFRVLNRLPDDTALLEAIPRTGRTHQIRLHLQHLGHPISGDPTYAENSGPSRSQTLRLEDPPMCLHALRLELIHPDSGAPVTYQARQPHWARP